MANLFHPDGRIVVVAIDHPLYTWPCPGLEDRRGLIEKAVAADADAFIGTYGTLRDLASSFGQARRILKLDLTTVSLHSYPLTPYRLAWSVDDALRLGVDAVLTYVQVGGPDELEALTAAAHVAAAADAAGLPYICESMPVESPAFPDAHDPLAVAAATRAAVELGAHVVKTTLPRPAQGLEQSIAFGVPVIVAGGDPAEGTELLTRVRDAVRVGAAGVAFGRNVWGATDPAARVAELVSAVHQPSAG
jgi:DhnA family fructose-bisphosphate aldolase class Ia